MPRGNGAVALAVEPKPRARSRSNGHDGSPELSKIDYSPPTRVTIAPPNLRLVTFLIEGDAPYVQNKFAAKAAIMAAQQEGSTAKNRKKKDPKDFEALFKAAQHLAEDGWHGMPAAGFRNAMIRACCLCGYKMTEAKMSVFVVGDGFDTEGTPLVKMTGKPRMHTGHVRNATGVVDIRSRPMWKEWSAKIKLRYDADQFRESDIANLLARAGQQVGVGEGRPFSKDSAGMGWGTFLVKS